MSKTYKEYYKQSRVNVLDEKRDNKVLEEDLDKLQASILIMQDKEIPEELRQKILDKNQKVSNSRLIQTQ